jgi:iron complex outermembrane receptor protein
MRSSALTSVTAAALIAICGQAQADTALGENSAPATGTGESQLDEIIVTAQKRPERSLDVPISITPLTAAQLDQTASKNLEELQGVVPGITFPAATAYGGSSIVIRGTSGSGTFLEDDPVAVYVDGIYQTSNSRFGVSDLTDIESVEVVRGPQGTLQGRNATAGAILVRTADPNTILDGFVRASVENPSGYRVEGAVSLPISDSLRIRLSADHFEEDGWAKNLYNDTHLGGENATNTRAIIIWQPNDRFTARLALNYQNLTNTQASQRWAATAVNPTGVAENLANPTPFVSLPPALQSHYLNDNVVYNDVLSRNIQRSPSAALEMHYNFGPTELVSLTGVSSASNAGQADSGGMAAVGTNGVSLIDAVTGEDRRAFNQGYITGSQVTEELRLQSTSTMPFKWLLGAYGSHAIDDFRFDIFDYNLASSPPGDGDVGFKAHQTDESLAAFLDATYSVTSRLSITGGVRYTEEQKQFNNTFSVTIPEIALVVVGPIPYAPPKGSWNNTSYRANAAYKITDDTLVYVSGSRGFKSGGFNAFGVGPTPSYEPETLNSVEIGAKSYLFDHRGYITTSFYDNSYDNLQVTAGVPTGGVNIYNAAKAHIDGFEVEGQWRLSDSLSTTANVAYTHAYYTKFENGQGVDGNLVNATGNELPNSPRWQYYIQGDYKVPLTAAWDAHAQVSYRWRDEVYFFATNETPNLTGGVDGELGARLEATYNPMQLTVSFYGRNLTNTRVVNGEQADFAYPVAFFNQPRVVGIQLSKKF